MALVYRGNRDQPKMVGNCSSSFSTRRCAVLCPRPLTQKPHQSLYKTWQTSYPSTISGVGRAGCPQRSRATFSLLLVSLSSPRLVRLPLDHHRFMLTVKSSSQQVTFGMFCGRFRRFFLRRTTVHGGSSDTMNSNNMAETSSSCCRCCLCVEISPSTACALGCDSAFPISTT